MIRGWILTCWAVLVSAALGQVPSIESTADLVGRGRDNVISTPVNQVLTPYGRQVELDGLRPQAIALSPDGRRLLVSGKTSELLAIDPDQAKVVQRVALPPESQKQPPKVASPNILNPDRKGQVSYTGLIYAHSGRRVYLSNVDGSIKVFAVAGDGTIEPTHVFNLPEAKAPRRKEEIPSGLALSDDDTRLYVCGNLSNTLLEISTADGKVLRTWDVGVAPYDVVLAKGKAFVSNWGGRRPGPGDLTGPAGRGTVVRVDPVRHIASEGSVSVVDLAANRVSKELITGLHASGLAASPDRKFVVCANAGSDNLSLIDVDKEAVVETVWAKARPSDLFGASPNALAFDDAGKRLYVANGSQNAVAVLRFDPEDKGDTKLQGLIPAGWFPGAVLFDARRKVLCVANIKGLPERPKAQKNGSKGFNSHHYSGSVSLMPIPSKEDLPKLAERAAKNMRRGAIAQAALPARKGQPPRAIPERIGEPSLIEHVVYVIKENRTYDQIFGKLPRGRGHADLCVFGAEVTPNQHKMVDEFVLLDNTYCAGICSADGHQWSTTAFGTDYMEKSFAGFPRSYPDGMGEDEADALAYSPAGFLWDNAVAHKKSIRNYGEFMAPKVRWKDPKRKGSPDYLSCYRTWKGESGDVIFECEPSVESLRPFSPTDYVGWEMAVPDQFRADYVIRELKEFERKGEFPNLVLICLPNDHTSGTSFGSPTPASCMADNDLAFGRVVEALSHSRFWGKMAIFGIEDDPQAGWDHVSGYRTTAYCISPYAKRKAVVSTQYNTTSLIRTIEQILGLPPMNQFDASATPMFDCFTDKPDPTPFESVANKVPLDQMNPNPRAIRDEALRRDALVSAQLNFREVDKAPEDVLNRILWRAQKGTAVPYPEWAVTLVEDDD
ncbi:Phosphoesterase family protein [Aquisphaera giovannonii]|uniref:Phosphoesterase family protein n=1 Tax=Aquisphaera giovannonii TaxID=406548 RepID=A0A5B9WC01_9BACT|nr:bifunctional YncE family protein/alkaline phosphatase family protein [Aquisphaera giovannonii]QEH38136.1 Phosphoesterase family protein [Aquisphaera giovannonii]